MRRTKSRKRYKVCANFTLFLCSRQCAVELWKNKELFHSSTGYLSSYLRKLLVGRSWKICCANKVKRENPFAGSNSQDCAVSPYFCFCSATTSSTGELDETAMLIMLPLELKVIRKVLSYYNSWDPFVYITYAGFRQTRLSQIRSRNKISTS